MSAPVLERPRRRRNVGTRRRRTARPSGSVLVAALAVACVLGLAIGVRAWSAARSARAARRPAAAMHAKLEAPRFARVRGVKLALALPARPPELIGIGFHQAQNLRAKELVPTQPWLARDDNTAAARLVKRAAGRGIVMFEMHSRGRGSKLTSAIDVVVQPETLMVSPVDGTVTLVKHYRLYGRYDDLHVEIEPDGHPDIRLVAIHIKDLQVDEGDRVVAGSTVLGRPRPFSFDAQVNRYVGGKMEHMHFQVNPYPPVGG